MGRCEVGGFACPGNSLAIHNAVRSRCKPRRHPYARGLRVSAANDPGLVFRRVLVEFGLDPDRDIEMIALLGAYRRNRKPFSSVPAIVLELEETESRWPGLRAFVIQLSYKGDQ